MPTTPTKSTNPIPNRDRMKMPRQHMPERPALERAQQFTEVNLGYSAELARQEALRCIECAKPSCTDTCPVGVKVKEFVQKIVDGDFLGGSNMRDLISISIAAISRYSLASSRLCWRIWST